MKRYKEQIKSLSYDEIIEIKEFYKNCPPGYEVDHIMPISLGGRHHILNLQYLTKEENRKKGANINFEITLIHFKLEEKLKNETNFYS